MAQLSEETPLRWMRPSWRAEVDTWIRTAVADRGRTVVTIEQPHVRPWGTALSVATDDGILWFKASMAPLAYEVPLLRSLRRSCPDRVPELLTGDDELGWMLLSSAGVPLSDLHPHGLPRRIWREVLSAFAELQLHVAADADELVASGVPDRRHGLVEGFERIVETQHAAGSITSGEHARLVALVPRLREAVDVVAALELPDSVQHDDLHPWNVCVGEGGYRFIDWGDACIAQPLLSLGVPLAHIEPADATSARDSYLEPWTAVRPRGELLAACDAAHLLARVTGLLKWELINSGLTNEELGSYGDVIPKRLRHLLEATCA